MDAGEEKKLVVGKLEALGVSFIDCGMGLELNDGSLGGILRVTASTPEKRDHVHKGRISFTGGGPEDIYASNIQVADLNALNALMAVIKMEKDLGLLSGPRTGTPLNSYDGRQHALERRPCMMRRRHFEHRFVQNIPEKLEPGILCISMEYATAAHSCFCGCGEEVVTPFSPTDWKLVFDGETVSLWPSVGSWTLRCRSHYVLDRGRIVEAGDWSKAAVAVERRRDKAAKES